MAVAIATGMPENQQQLKMLIEDKCQCIREILASLPINSLFKNATAAAFCAGVTEAAFVDGHELVAVHKLTILK